MKILNTVLILALVIFCTLVSVSCSNGKSPVEPAIDEISGIPQDLPESINTETSNRNLFAVYDAVIDPSAQTFTVTPAERDTQYHFPLTQLFPNVLSVTGYGFTPNFWADIRISHPLPGSVYYGFDPRVIAILPARDGVYFFYPTLGVFANNAVVLEPDGYTKLFDNLGGPIAGSANPFKAYFKSQPYRRWASSGATAETQRWQMNLAGFNGSLQFKLVVDVSTNYPNPQQPVIDNAQEPVQIVARVNPGLTTQGSGGTNVTVTLLDWQGQAGIGGVQVEALALFNGTVSLTYSTTGLNPNEYVYTGTITNALHAPRGNYKVLVAAWDQATNIYIYKECYANVSDAGNLIWAKNAGSVQNETGNGVTTLSDNSTVVTGYFSLTATFGQGEFNQTVLTSLGAYDFFIARYNPNGTLAWAKSAGGTGSEIGEAVTTALSDDSTIVTGRINGTTTFGPGESNETILTPASQGYWDIFIAKYNPNGSLKWAKSVRGGNENDIGYDITTLADDSTVMTGNFIGKATFGPGEPNEKSLTSGAFSDIFIARYDREGSLVWAKSAGGPDFDFSYGITSLSDNSTVVTGSFYVSTTFGPGESNEITLTADSDYKDIFVAQYNPDGTLAWAKRAGGSSNDQGNAITSLSDDSTVVTGYFDGLAIFGPGESNETKLISGSYWDIFIAQYRSDGKLQWARSAKGDTGWDDEGSGITTLSDDSTVITGSYTRSVIFGSGELNETLLSSGAYSTDAFIVRLSRGGDLIWAKRAGGTHTVIGNEITSLSDDTTVVTGIFYMSETFGPGEVHETVLVPVDWYDMFIARFEP